MKYVIILFFFCTQLIANNDSLKKNTVYIHTMPSNLLVGDISLGVEHLYKKRFSQEFQAYWKCFKPAILIYDKGFKLNYQLKYNVIHRQYFRMSVNVSTSYKEAGFHDKKSYWSEQKEFYGDMRPQYIMDREMALFGIGGGIGLTFKISKHLYIGNELLLEICKEKKSYVVKAEQKPLTNEYIPLAEPYYYNSITFSGFQKCNPIFNIKLSYRL
ncbi:MAG: hypothetical protein HY062_06925 [Bacteroidetes bacterium]|nr:hypothetical protein [Bacteroidota bacterium]